MDTDLGPRLTAELERLTPEQRRHYDVFMAGYRREWEQDRISRAAVLDRIESNRRPRWKRKAAEVQESVESVLLVAVIVVGCAGLFGTCVGVVVALIRAGWRAGASL